MWVILLLCVVLAHDCDISLNGLDSNDKNDYINKDCNFAGVCWDADEDGTNTCNCCDSTNPKDEFCQHRITGSYDGKTCGQAKYWTKVTFGYIIQGDGVTCANDGSSSAVPNMLNETISALEEYDGEILSLDCEICTVDSPCEFFEKPPVQESGIFVKLGTDLNTYYDLSCGKGDLPGSNLRVCPANNDFGIDAWQKMEEDLDKNNNYARIYETIPELMGYGSGELSGTNLERVYMKEGNAFQTITRTTRLPTPSPTPEPTTPSPTESPTQSPTPPITTDIQNPCEDYINEVSSLHFMSPGSSCRANISESWPGGQTCDSPYIVCLPAENTPSMHISNRTYKNDTHRYTVKECLEECSFDQRCLGVEFVADASSAVGDCNLIDDIPIGVADPVSDYTYVPDSRSHTNTNLDSSITGGDVLCWEKVNYCNPYFESEDLNDVMLNCYCPNNRKGYYTKKVQRTVENTRFCGNDSSVDNRIRKAQANRMFHLCENWCLFETLNPEQESWYWDPWKKCWRETYSGAGAHRAYCDRVIRNPDSIELQFVNYRNENFLSCDGTRPPTKVPVQDINTTYILSEKSESCGEACSRNGKECAADQTARVFATESQLITAFSEAGFTCEEDSIIMERKRFEGWALPGVRGSSVCVNRQPTLSHLQDLYSDCSRILGTNWQRLCACF